MSDKLFRIIKFGKGIGFEMPDGSRISCECIGEPYSNEIIAAFNESQNKESENG